MTTEEKIKALWGEDLYNYAYQKSIELIGYPEFTMICVGAIAKMVADGLLTVKAKVGGV